MAKNKHTIGPWRLRGSFVIPERESGSICNFSIGNCRRPGTPEGKANANLIVASPKLLAACKAILECTDYNVESYEHLDETTIEAFQMIEDAVDAAEGKHAKSKR